VTKIIDDLAPELLKY